jgi:hypothetical protein
MPSYRVTLFVERMQEGIPPETALTTAVDAINSCAVAEAYEVRLVDRRGALVIRFAAEHDEHARDVALTSREAVDIIAITGGLRLQRRAGNLWHHVAPV